MAATTATRSTGAAPPRASGGRSVATVPQAEIFNYCNGDNYTDNGNNGSVKKYFQDVSANLLTYSNVVTIYLRAPEPKTY